MAVNSEYLCEFRVNESFDECCLSYVHAFHKGYIDTNSIYSVYFKKRLCISARRKQKLNFHLFLEQK